MCKIYFLMVIYGTAFLFIGVCLCKHVVNGDFKYLKCEEINLD